jgi:hypothetical protein
METGASFDADRWAEMLHSVHKDEAIRIIADHIAANAGDSTAWANWWNIQAAFEKLTNQRSRSATDVLNREIARVA